MVKICEQIIAAQHALGLENPKHLKPGIHFADQKKYPFLVNGFKETEIADLYSWKDGCNTDAKVSMAKLWLFPDYFWLSADVVQAENKYLVSKMDDWSSNWFPLFSNGTADRLFVDSSKLLKRQVPVFYAFWESPEPLGQIYDSVNAMMVTIQKCYQEGVYYLDESGLLSSIFSEEVKISNSLNPHSDYWQRSDLF